MSTKEKRHKIMFKSSMLDYNLIKTQRNSKLRNKTPPRYINQFKESEAKALRKGEKQLTTPPHPPPRSRRPLQGLSRGPSCRCCWKQTCLVLLEKVGFMCETLGLRL
jgi:hypothetical protein